MWRRAVSGIVVLVLAPLAIGPSSAAAAHEQVDPVARSVDVPAVHLPPAGTPGTVVVVGDSVTQADSPSVPTGRFGPNSWASTVDRVPVDVRGGWAVRGATTTDMLAGVRGTTGAALAGDVLVLMAGTNDVRFGVSWAESERNLERIVAAVGADRVILCTIVPLDEDPAGGRRFNTRLRALAEDDGWELVDSAAGVRNADGGWVPGTSDDGLHPNRVGAGLIGSIVRHALVEAATPATAQAGRPSSRTPSTRSPRVAVTRSAAARRASPPRAGCRQSTSEAPAARGASSQAIGPASTAVSASTRTRSPVTRPSRSASSAAVGTSRPISRCTPPTSRPGAVGSGGA